MISVANSMRDTSAWHPDNRASLVIAFTASMLVMAGFATLFLAAPRLRWAHDIERDPERLVLTPPISQLPARHPRHRTLASFPQVSPLQTISPLPLPPLAAPHPFTMQGYLDEREQQNSAVLRDKVTAGDLQRGLGKVTEKPALSDNQGYRTAGGQEIVRNGDDCAQIQVVQGSSSPTNRAYVAEPTDCPGATPDAGQEMGKSLNEWAKKVQQSQSPPPVN